MFLQNHVHVALITNHPCTGAMGFCCDVRCYNAPHLYQLGWANALGTLYKDNFSAGKWLTYSLPAAVTASRHFVKIRPNWGTSGNNYNLFISYRWGGCHVHLVQAVVCSMCLPFALTAGDQWLQCACQRA